MKEGRGEGEKGRRGDGGKEVRKGCNIYWMGKRQKYSRCACRIFASSCTEENVVVAFSLASGEL